MTVRAGALGAVGIAFLLMTGCRGPGFGTISSYPGYGRPVILSQSPMGPAYGGYPMVGSNPGCPSCAPAMGHPVPMAAPYGQPAPYRQPTPYGPRADATEKIDPTRPGDPGYKDVPTYRDPITPADPLPPRKGDPLTNEPPLPPIKGGRRDDFGGAKPFSRDRDAKGTGSGTGLDQFGKGNFAPSQPPPFQPSAMTPTPLPGTDRGARTAGHHESVPLDKSDSFHPPAPFRPAETERSLAARLPSGDEAYDYDKAEFRWLKGTVDYDQSQRSWHIIYALVPDSDDPFGGGVTLTGTGLSALRNGQSVLVRGHIDHQQHDSRGKSCFRVQSISAPRQ